MWDSSWCPQQRLNHLRSGRKDKTQLARAKQRGHLKLLQLTWIFKQYWSDLLPPDTNIYQTGFHLLLINLTFLVIFTFVYTPFLAPHSQILALTRLLHSGIFEKQTSGSVPFVRGGGNHRHRWEQCSVHLPVIPVNVPHHTTSYTNWQPEPPPWRPAP